MDELDQNAIDPEGWGPVNRDEEFYELKKKSPDALVRLIQQRNDDKLPSYRARKALREILQEIEEHEEPDHDHDCDDDD